MIIVSLILIITLIILVKVGKPTFAILAQVKSKSNSFFRNRMKSPKTQELLVSIVTVAAAILLIITASSKVRNSSFQDSESLLTADLIFVIDVSLSMYSDDIVPSRLQHAQDTILQLLPKLSGNRLGLVVFSGGAFVFCPMTSDLTSFSDYVKSLGPDMVGEKGTDLTKAIRMTNQFLKSEKVKRNRLVIFISDGEDEENPNLSSVFADVVVWGVGTTEGGRIFYKDAETGTRGYVTKSGILTDDPDSELLVISKLNPRALQTFANENSGSYVNNALELESTIEKKLKNLQEKSEISFGKVLVEEGAYPILFLALLLLISEKLYRLFWKTSFVIFIFTIASFSIDAKSWGLDPGGDKVSDGIKAYEEKRALDANKNFLEADEFFPNDPRLKFNKGTSAMQIGDSKEAERLFREALSDPSLPNGWRAKALYNLGNLFAKEDKKKEAIESYKKAIEYDSTWQDPKKNMELLRRKSNSEPNKSNQSAENQGSKSKKENQQSPSKPKSDKNLAEEMLDSINPNSVLRSKFKDLKDKDVFW